MAVDVIEQDEELEQQDIQQQDEPQTTLPEHTEKHVDRQDVFDEALAEGVEEATIEELAAKPGDLTIDDLRKLPGADEYTDEQLQAEWEKAVASARGQVGATGDTQQQQQEEFKLPFPIYDAQGNKIEALDKISLKDLFDGKLQIGYQAMGKEQRKTLTDAIRNASMGHWNEQKYQTTVEERNRVAQEVGELRKQVDQHNTDRKTWDAALTALAMGNAAPMKALADAFQKALQAAPANVQPGTMGPDEVRAERERVQAGLQIHQQYIVPEGIKIATRYGAKAEEVIGAIQWFIEREPAQFFTKEKLDAIINYEVPALFESHGYKAQSDTAGQTGRTEQQAPNEIDELKKTVAALQSQIAGTRNQQTQAARDKTRKAPSPGSGATPGAGDSMPTFKSRAQFKAWSAGDPDWQKA